MYIMRSMEHDIKYLLWMYETRAYKDITFDMINTYRASITTAHFQRHIHILNMPYKVCFLSIVWKIPCSVHCTLYMYTVQCAPLHYGLLKFYDTVHCTFYRVRWLSVLYIHYVLNVQYTLYNVYFTMQTAQSAVRYVHF